MNKKIVVIGGTGLIGSKVVEKLTAQGDEAVAAAPSTGVNILTGEGLSKVLTNASILIDVSNSPSFEEKAVMDFFQTSTRNLLSFGANAGVTHYVALSVVGTDRLGESAYIRAKIAQEKLITQSSIPYSIVHATQFFEFANQIADASMIDGKVHLPNVFIQPMAAEDVAKEVTRVAIGKPFNGIVEVGGPERLRMPEFVREALRARSDTREVVADPDAKYYGAKLKDLTLVPADGALLAETRFHDWLSPAVAQK